jgi:hypothetical protein
MAAMRERMDAPCITAAHFAAARTVLAPSIKPDAVAASRAFAERQAR